MPYYPPDQSNVDAAVQAYLDANPPTGSDYEIRVFIYSQNTFADIEAFLATYSIPAGVDIVLENNDEPDNRGIWTSQSDHTLAAKQDIFNAGHLNRLIVAGSDLTVNGNPSVHVIHTQDTVNYYSVRVSMTDDTFTDRFSSAVHDAVTNSSELKGYIDSSDSSTLSTALSDVRNLLNAYTNVYYVFTDVTTDPTVAPLNASGAQVEGITVDTTNPAIVTSGDFIGSYLPTTDGTTPWTKQGDLSSNQNFVVRDDAPKYASSYWVRQTSDSFVIAADRAPGQGNIQTLTPGHAYDAVYATPLAGAFGYATITNIGSLAAFTGATIPAIPDNTYDLDVTIDGGSNHQLSVVVAATDSWDTIAANLQTALQTATSGSQTVAITGGKIKITSAIQNDSSAVLIATGTAGSGGGDLLAAIDALSPDYTTQLDTPVSGHPGAADIRNDQTPYTFTGTDVPGLADNTYDIDVTVNGGSLIQLTVDLIHTDNWDAIAAKLQTALQTATGGTESVYTLSGGGGGHDIIRFQSTAAVADGSMLIATGTAGSGGGDLVTAINALLSHTLVLQPANGVVCKLTPTEDLTLQVMAPPTASDLILLIETSGTTSYNITFDSGFTARGNLATGTTDGKKYVLQFASDGSNYLEATRTSDAAIISNSMGILRSTGQLYYDFDGDGTTMTVTVPDCYIDLNTSLLQVWDFTNYPGQGGDDSGQIDITSAALTQVKVTNWNQFTIPTTNGNHYRVIAIGQID